MSRGVRRLDAALTKDPLITLGGFWEFSGRILGIFWEDIILSQPFPALSQKFPAISQLSLFAGLFTLARLRFAAEASKNLESAATPPTYWIAAVSAAEEFLTTKNTKNT